MKFVMAPAFNNSQHLFRTMDGARSMSLSLSSLSNDATNGCAADSLTQCTRLLTIGMYPCLWCAEAVDST